MKFPGWPVHLKLETGICKRPKFKSTTGLCDLLDGKHNIVANDTVLAAP
jgi:hypothetical protein